MDSPQNSINGRPINGKFLPSICFMYFSRSPFPPQPYSVILSVHNGSLLHFPEDSGVHTEHFGPLLHLTVACPQNRMFFSSSESYDYLTENLLISGLFFKCLPTQQVLKICIPLLNTSCLMEAKYLGKGEDSTDSQSLGNPCHPIILRFSCCSPTQQHP